MSSSDHSGLRLAPFFGLLGMALAGCQVTPLYSHQPTGSIGALAATVAVEEPSDRVELVVRNELIFLLQGGSGEPATPRYRLEMTVLRTLQDILLEANDARPGGRNLTLVGQYRLVETATGRQIAVRQQRATAVFDEFTQAFANRRAERDAENRAARELAERIRADLAIVLASEVSHGPDQGA